MNHEGYDRRLKIILDVLHEHDIEPSSITPIEYDEECPFPYNNFIYKIQLVKPLSDQDFNNGQPCTTLPAPEGLSTLVFRLSNSRADGLNNTNRIENEVASMFLARESLAKNYPELAQVVPAIYAWKPMTDVSPADETGFAWSIMEYKSGIPLDSQFSALSTEDKKFVTGQIADVLSAIQAIELPEGVREFGGLTITEEGSIVTGEMTTLKGGPWPTYEEFWLSRLHAQLKDAGESPALNGWTKNGVRERIDEFFTSGLRNVVKEAKIDTSKLTLVHGDLTTNNMLFDTTTKRITAVLDFDFAAILHPCHEFFSSLSDVGGNTHAHKSETINKAVQTGDFSGLGPEDAEDEWTMAKTWDAALVERNAIRPGNIPKIEVLEKLRQLEALICPFTLCHPVFLARKTEEDILKEKNIAESKLVDFLISLES